MRVFVTGASGFIGSAVVRNLLDAGHQVLGLARSDASASALAAIGATPHRGDLQDLPSLRSGAELSDGVIHTAFIHDFAKFKENCEIDRAVIETLGAVVAGTERPLVITSGTGLLANAGLITEADRTTPGAGHPRVASEEAAAAAVAKGARVSVVRLPPSVHGVGDHGFVPLLIGLAREKGLAAYVGDGANRWPAVHRFDAADRFRLALEKGEADARYHGSAEDGVPFREIAEVIGRRLGLPVVSLSPEEAAGHFGWFAHFAAMDNPSSSDWTRQTLGWRPTAPGLIADLDQPAYFGS
ncbi:MAG: SDR family oxidoreductase [Rhizobiales bacterium]|nr:SDR family oxidoreductase [Hyphomicrobiales bacterium]